MFSTMTTDSILWYALAAAKSASRHAYVCCYAGGARTVKREPDQNTRHFTGLCCSHYGAKAGVTLATARKHLRLLAQSGLISEGQRSRPGAVLRFRLRNEDADRIGRELIDELRAEGLPWDDEWLADRAAKRAAQRGEGQT